MSKCIVKILRDETPGGLAEKINKELEKKIPEFTPEYGKRIWL